MTDTDKILNPTKLAVWQLRTAGYSPSQVAQMMCISVSTVYRYDKEVRNDVDEALPSVVLAASVLDTMVPRALKVYETLLKDNDLKAARDILVTKKIVKDHRTVEVSTPLGDLTNEDIIAKLDNLLKKAKGE